MWQAAGPPLKITGEARRLHASLCLTIGVEVVPEPTHGGCLHLRRGGGIFDLQPQFAAAGTGSVAVDDLVGPQRSVLPIRIRELPPPCKRVRWRSVLHKAIRLAELPILDVVRRKADVDRHGLFSTDDRRAGDSRRVRGV